VDEAARLFLAGDLEGSRSVLLGVDLSRARSAEAYELAGMLEEAAGKSESARDLYTKGLAVKPNAALYAHRADLLRKREDFDAALADMDRAAALAPMDIGISNERLLLLVQAGRIGQADAEIKAIREREGTGNAGAWLFGVCGIALENGEYSEAKKILTLAKQSIPPKIFDRMLKDPVLIRHMTRPEITPFYLGNLPPP
jgi:tetratricopeptide (TPR) repeat protein